MSRRTWELLALAALTLLAHAGSLANGFVYDDHRFVVENAALDHLGVGDALLDPSAHTADDDRDVYRPLRALSHAFDRERWGLDPFGFHLHSVLLHAACVLLAAFALRRLLPARFAPAALAGAGLLAVHPVGVEAVGWVTSRGDQLALGLALLTLLAAGLSRRALAWPLVALGAGAATLGKESAAVLPAVILLHGLLDRRANERARAPLVRGAALAAAVGVGAALLLRQLALEGASPVQTPPHGGSLVAQTGWALFGAGTSALHLLWPTELSVRYPAASWAEAGAPWLQLPGLLGLALVLGLGALAWRLRRAREAPALAVWSLFLAGWAALAYLPSSSLLVTLRELVNDRALLPCLPALGALLALPFCGARLRVARAAAALALVALLLPVTWRRVDDFADDVRLWNSVLRVDPTSPGAHLGLARELLLAGDAASALQLMERGARAAPSGTKQHAELLAHWGDALLRHGDDRHAALSVLGEALAAVRHWDALEHPSMIGDATAASLAEALVAAGRADEAFALLDRERARAARPEQLDLKRALLLRELVRAPDGERWLPAFDLNYERVARELPDHPLVQGLAEWRARL